MKKKIIIFIAVAVIAGFGARSAQALNFQLKKPLQLDPAAMKAFHDARCAKFKDKMETKISNIQDKQEQHKNTLDNLTNRLGTLISRLNDKGYDTAQLKTDRDTLSKKIEKFKSDVDALAEEANNTKDNVCSDDDTKIKANLGETRTLVQAVRSDIKDIRTFYQNEIRPDIQAIKNQTPTQQ